MWHDRLFSTQYACPNCKISYEELEPRTFSFNSPYGACPKCEGLGSRVAFDPELVLPDAGLSLAAGAIAPWQGETPAAVRKHQNHLRPFLAKAGIGWNTPLETLSPKLREQLLHGSGKRFLGVLEMLEKEYATTASETKRQRLEAFRGEVVCPECGGARLRPEARSVSHRRPGDSRGHRDDGRRRAAVLPRGWEFAVGTSGRRSRRRGDGRAADEDDMSSHSALSPRLPLRTRIRHPHPRSLFPAHQRPIAQPILGEIAARLDFLDRVGLGYLTLDRPAGTLSGGELQRVRLAAGLGSGLVGVCYVLDEPSIGLHPRDNQRLIDTLRQLQSRGNTVVVVEHDETIMRQADWLVDLGPGAGRHGGRVVAEGPPERIAADPAIAHRPLSGRRGADSRARAPPPRGQDAGDHPRRRDHQQSQERQRAVPAFGVGLRHRRERLGQEFAAGRDACPGAGAPAGRHRAEARPAHQPPRRQPDRQGGGDRSIADRAHAAEQSGHLHRRVRRNPQGVRQHPRRHASAATRPAASASTSTAGGARSARARGSGGSR